VSTVLVTGGTGSLGRALLARYLKDPAVEKVICFSRDELKQADIAEAYPAESRPGGRLRLFLGDVRDRERLERAMYGVTRVVHAAALKRVDAVSYNPGEVFKTNVQGTVNVIDAAIAAEVCKVIVVSSDKAVNPQNIYGASKFMAEQYAIEANSYGKPQGTLISCVRYGNVLGSRGSVVHVFKRMAENGGIKLTDPRCTRFLITMGQACGLIDYAFETMKGAEIFVPRLPSILIKDLAAVMNPGSEPEVIGLRHGGEKLAEMLLNDEEVLRTVCKEGNYVVGGQGIKLDPEFRYASDVNPWRLAKPQIRDLLAEEGYL